MNTSLRKFALRNIAKHLASADTEQEFEHSAKWLVVYLNQLGFIK
jgi:hypothetical protein